MYTRHHAIVVTGISECGLKEAHKKAKAIFPEVSEIIPTKNIINGCQSFFIPPDGSNEGWDDSTKGDDNRDRFLEWLESKRGVFELAWVEVQYGDGNYDTRIVRDSDASQRNETE
jgi:hypothetical protein